jgi:hypothetical protein
MKFHSVGFQAGSSYYSLHQVTGSLLEYQETPKLKSGTNFPEKLRKALGICRSPYLAAHFQSLLRAESPTPHFDEILLRRARYLIRLCRANHFWLACKYASFARPGFESSAAAIAFFRNHTSRSQQNSLCLPRSLFAASTSRRFKASGVLFIGVFLPSRAMHAWIIENACQPDADDSMWINFRPVAAFC